MFAQKEFEKRFRDILEELDSIMENSDFDEDINEQFAELNAESEDALFLLSEIGSDEEDAAEAIEDALDEFEALCEDYRELSEELTEIAPQVQRLGMLIEMMKNNL